MCPEATTLELVITPSQSSALQITWTELHAVLSDVLTEAKHIHVVCSKPERLARLFILPEGELVGVGECHDDRGLFGTGYISSDRQVRESLQREVLVTTSERTVEEIDQGLKEGLRVWKLGTEVVTEEFASKPTKSLWSSPQASSPSGEPDEVRTSSNKSFSMKAFERVEVGESGWRSVRNLFEAAKISALSCLGDSKDVQSRLDVVEVVKEEAEKPGMALTQEVLEKHTEEIVTLHPDTAYKKVKKNPGRNIEPVFD